MGTEIEVLFVALDEMTDRGIACGRFYELSKGEEVPFTDFSDLMRKANERINGKIGCEGQPMDHTDPSNGQIEAYRIQKERNREKTAYWEGVIYTAVIEIRYRQNASWQGILQVPRMGVRQNFRSVLELLMLLQTAAEDAVRKEPDGLKQS